MRSRHNEFSEFTTELADRQRGCCSDERKTEPPTPMVSWFFANHRFPLSIHGSMSQWISRALN